MKTITCIANILHIATEPTPLYSPSSTTCSEPNSISLPLVYAELSYLSKLPNFQLTHSVGHCFGNLNIVGFSGLRTCIDKVFPGTCTM